MSPIGILLWIKATKEIFATQFFLPARSSIKIASLLKYSFGLHLLECGNVAIANDISWAFLPLFRAKIETSSEAFSNQKPLKKNQRVSIKLEAVRFLMAPLLEAEIPVKCSAWSLLQIELTKLILGFNDIQLFCPCHSLSLSGCIMHIPMDLFTLSSQVKNCLCSII